MTGDLVIRLANRLVQTEFIKHLMQLLARFPQKQIILFVDSFPTHTTPLVRTFLKNNPRLKLMFMPKYSPKLNVIESLWKELKETLGNWFYSTIPKMERAINRFFRKLWYNKQKVISLIGFNKKYSI